jgi:hypothetical protein
MLPPYRIMVKIREDLGFAYPEEQDTTAFFMHCDAIPWSHWSHLFPGIIINRLFTSLPANTIRKLAANAMASDTTYKAPDFCTWYVIVCPVSNNAEALLQTVLQCEHIVYAYLQNNIQQPPAHVQGIATNDDQGYLDAAPRGINARYAWSFAGGDGDSRIKFIDIEQGWGLQHRAIRATTLPSTGFNSFTFEDHGTAVLGIISMNDKENGRKGIAPKANGHVISLWRPDDSFNLDDAIMAAIQEMQAGDILLLQSQVFEPYDSPVAWPVEINEASFDVIRLATALGIIVIEPSGNGNLEEKNGNDLDLYTRHHQNILGTSSGSFKDSGAIIVAASSAEVPFTRITSSNYGSRVNCFARGEKVVTAGGYPGPSGFATNIYTSMFGGTSAASAIIAGAALLIQGIADTNLSSRFSPLQLRAILSNHLYGTSSLKGNFTDKIGVMPDLQKVITRALNMAPSLRNNGSPQQ